MLRAAVFSWRGLAAAWRDEPAFRLEVAAAAALSAGAFWLDVGGGSRALLVAAAVFVPAVELLNTALEAAADLAADGKRHPLAAKIKDCGSAAVLLSIIIAAAVWAGVLWPN